MNETTANLLSINGVTEFYKIQDLDILRVNHPLGTAVISLYGAQVLSFIPINHPADLLWMSEGSAMETGKPIRGGIPVCFPWFGPHASDHQLPQHGFARLMIWDLMHIHHQPETFTEITFQLTSNPETQHYWPYAFSATIKIRVGATLELSLTTSNTGDKEFVLTDALHTYLKVTNCSTAQLQGMQQISFLAAGSNEVQTDTDDRVRFGKGEINRRYFVRDTQAYLEDTETGRIICIDKKGSGVTVVWNPGPAIAATIKDIPEGGYTGFICVEAANACKGVDEIVVNPGESHTLSTTISVIS